MPRLKVFCTTSGFHDSVVAAPSRPAALKAWGARTDLFSMGAARQVTDPKIVKKALAKPGEVIRLDRSGGEEVHPARKDRERKKPAARPPSRARLASAEKRLEDLSARQAKERDQLERWLAALKKKGGQLGKRHAKARRAAEQKLEDARAQYEAALEKWQD